MTQHKLGRYEIIEEIGSGGFAAVFRARDTVLNREVAVKVMRPLLMSDAGFVARFEREAQVAANLEHPHIIPVYDYGEENGRLYIVMKLVREGSLERRLEQGPIPFAQTMTVASQIAAALDYAHEQQVIHRDIKPDNVLLGRNDHVYLGDFGLVKALEQSSLTASLSGGVLGTPAYVAPEIWHGQVAAPQADVYALACLLFEMVMGKPLFHAPTPPATMLLHFKEPVFPDQWPTDVPAGFAAVLRQALAQEPGERHASAGALVAAITDLTNVDPLAEPYAVLQASLQAQAWDRAVEQAEAILAQDSGYRDIQTLLNQALVGKAQAEQAVWAAHWRKQAQGAVQQQNWTIAQQAINRWLDLAPDDSDALELQTQVEAVMNDAKSIHETAKKSQSEPVADSEKLYKKTPALVDPQPISSGKKVAPVADTNKQQLITWWPWALGAVLVLLVAGVSLNIMFSDDQAGSEWVRSVDGMVMVYVPPPSIFGIATGEGFWIDRHPVTNAQYQLCVSNGSCNPSRMADDARFNGDNYPVVGVSWFDANDYVSWLNEKMPDDTEWLYALPDEAMWEHAAIGNSGQAYPWGNEEANCELANTSGCVGRTAQVGSYPDGVSWVGALDMAGNVWEWTDSWSDEGETNRILRGGSWFRSQDFSRATYRNENRPDFHGMDYSFRVVAVRASSSSP